MQPRVSMARKGEDEDEAEEEKQGQLSLAHSRSQTNEWNRETNRSEYNSTTQTHIRDSLLTVNACVFPLLSFLVGCC